MSEVNQENVDAYVSDVRNRLANHASRMGRSDYVIDALVTQLDEARAELAHLRQMEELLIARSNRMQTERDALRATVARQSEALKCANSALTECEAILGGEYGDHYGTLINTMLDLREKIAALAAKGETWPAPTC